MAALLERTRDGGFRRLRVLPRFERADPLHQVVPQSNTEAMCFSRCEHATCLVLLETFLRRVRRLSDIKRGKGARYSYAFAIELDDVNRVDRFRTPARSLLRSGHYTTSIGSYQYFFNPAVTTNPDGSSPDRVLPIM